MPHYFFDLQSGREGEADASGTELAGAAEARREALARATRAVEEHLAQREEAEVAVHVREGDRSLFVVRLSITEADPRGDGLRPDQLNSGNDV